MTRKVFIECDGEVVTELNLPDTYENMSLEEVYEKLLWQIALKDAGICILEELE